MFLYVILNLLDGERGLISYYEKQNTKKHLIKEKKFLVAQLKSIEENKDEQKKINRGQKNNLLTRESTRAIDSLSVV